MSKNYGQQQDWKTPILDSQPRLHLTIVLCKTPVTLQTILRVMGKILNRNETPTTELNFFLSKKISTENNKAKEPQDESR